jgi:hypothetical protein
MRLLVKSWTLSVAVVLGVAGCARSAPPPQGFEAVSATGATATTALMLRHFDHARTLSSSAIFGRPERARAAALAIQSEGSMGAGLSADAQDEYDAFVASVGAVEHAEGRAQLAMAAAEVAQRCGACHLAAGLGPTFAIGRMEDPVTPRDHLRVLAWGSSRMWEALVGGSDLAWRAGARALSGQLLREDLYAARVRDLDEGRRLAGRLHDLGVRALSVSEPNERATLLGEVWGTCSACHELVGLAQ